jgi:DNA polymerase-3 subunit delta'
MTRVTPHDAARTLPGIESHPHARALLLPALDPAGAPSHAYLFHGPAGVGKRTVARAFAAALLADGARAPATVLERVARDAHPDLTWVTPSGASEVLVSDIDEPVVAAATRTPFESRRRVFVIEAAGTMNDQAANRLLKTLEEPPPFAHLILLADHREDVLPTIASRCQQVRFDPLPSEVLQQRLEESTASDAAGETINSPRAAACARLAGGDARLAALLASAHGAALREWAEGFTHDALAAHSEDDPVDRSSPNPAQRAVLLDLAKAAGAAAGAAATERLQEHATLLPRKERRRFEREGVDVVRRAERRARTATLDLGLRLVESWLRDVWCVAVGARELVHAVDRGDELVAHAHRRHADSLLRGVELVRDTRLRLALNVSEELALEALAFRLADLLSE